MRAFAAPEGSRTLAVTRIARVGGHALEALGRSRLEGRGLDLRARLRAQAARLSSTCAEVCRVHGFRLRVHGALPERPAVLVANHLSYVDALVLAAIGPSAPIAKSELADWPLVGQSARSLGVVFVRRGDAWSGALALRQGLRALDAGVSVLGFPEGTTTHGHELLPFKRGMFGLARLTDAPIVPIALRYSSPEVAWVGDEWFFPHYVRTCMRPITLVDITIGPPIDPNVTRSAEDLAFLAHTRLSSLLSRSR